MKKVMLGLAAVISTVVVLGATPFNTTGYPIVKTPVEIKISAATAPLSPNIGEMEIAKRWEKQTGVKVKWECVPDTNYQEKKNLMLASGDLPDAFYNAGLTDNDIVTYGSDGTLIPLEGLIEKYAPNIKNVFKRNPKIKSMITAPDGHIYTLPRAEEMDLVKYPFTMYINKSWLDKLGLKVPETAEELKTVLKAFKEKDPNGNGKADEIPLSFMFEAWCGDIGELFTSFGIPDNNDHKIVKKGKVIVTATTNEYKNAVKYINSLYADKLIDQESFTQDIKTYLAKGKGKDATVGMFVWWEAPEMVGADRAKDYVLLQPLKDKNGKRMAGRSNYSEYNRGAFAITKANRNPEITMRWVDNLFEPKMAAQVNWGPIGVIYNEVNGKLVNKELPAGTNMGEYRQKVAPSGVGAVLKSDFGKIVEMEPRAKQRLDDLKKNYDPYMVKENFPPVFYTPNEIEKLATLEADIKPFISSQRAKWMVAGGIDNEWTGYLDKLNKMGYKEMIAIYQAGLDRYNGKK